MKYEYKVLKFDVTGWLNRKVDSNEIENELNRHGAHGWDLVKMTEILRDSGVTSMLIATLKRPA